MFPSIFSNNSLTSDETTTIISSNCSRVQDFGTLTSIMLQNSLPSSHHPPQKPKKKRNLPGNPDPDAEVIALSPTTLMATNRFVCEVCNKGFQRDQNLQLHRRGHNLPWKLKQRNGKEMKKRAYVCPEATCLHHHPSRALGDLTGIKKHYCRKHGEKKWKCEKCSKIYAVQSDWKAHSKTCGTREYRCDCGTLFSRKDSFITHRAFCDALAEESARISAATNSILGPNPNINININNNNNNNITAAAATAATTQPYFHLEHQNLPPPPPPPHLLPFTQHHRHFSNPNNWGQPVTENQLVHIKHEDDEELHYNIPFSSPLYQNKSPMMTSPFGNLHHATVSLPPLSATALLQRAAIMGGSTVGHMSSTMAHLDMHVATSSQWQNRGSSTDGFTRDFLGLTGDQSATGSTSGDGGGGNIRDVVSFTGSGVVKFPAAYDRHNYNSVLKNHGFEFSETCSGWGNC